MGIMILLRAYPVHIPRRGNKQYPKHGIASSNNPLMLCRGESEKDKPTDGDDDDKDDPEGGGGGGNSTNDPKEPPEGGDDDNSSTLVQYGDDFGKMGTYVEKPDIKIDWTQITQHALERLPQREMTQEMVNEIIENGKVLAQDNGSKFAFITKEGVAIVSETGKLITAWTNKAFDDYMWEIVKKLFGE